MTKDMKFDGGKMLAAIPFQDFPDAIEELVKVCTFGANKYERASWKAVSNAAERYEDALGRHFLAQYKEDIDPESKLYHKAHLAWNALATLQLEIDSQKNEPKQENNWVPYYGSRRPNEVIGRMVEVRLKDGDVPKPSDLCMNPYALDWTIRNLPTDITHYRIIQ